MDADVRDYTLAIDALHRNVWPVQFDGETIGQLTEHITVALDGGERGYTSWSWKLFVSKGDPPATVGTSARFRERDVALATLAQVHHAIYWTGVTR